MSALRQRALERLCGYPQGQNDLSDEAHGEALPLPVQSRGLSAAGHSLAQVDPLGKLAVNVAVVDQALDHGALLIHRSGGTGRVEAALRRIGGYFGSTGLKQSIVVSIRKFEWSVCRSA